MISAFSSPNTMAMSSGGCTWRSSSMSTPGVYAEIGGLVVERRRRKKGIGKLLMTGAEEWAREQGCSVVRLRSSAVRTEAHRFYEGPRLREHQDAVHVRQGDWPGR
jgi:GNAT superfamily N-acetyltransferase